MKNQLQDRTRRFTRLGLALTGALTFTNVLALTHEEVLAWIAAPAVTADPPAAGTTLTEADMAVIARYLPPGFAEEFNFPGARLEIQAAMNYQPHPVYQEATAKFAGQATLAADGALENYTAGQPFSAEQILAATPEAAGHMLAWNRIHRWQYYGWGAKEVVMSYLRANGGGPGPQTEGLTGGGKLDRFTVQNYQRVYLNHLAMLPNETYQVGASDSGNRFYKDHVEFVEPFDVKGTQFVIERPLDAHEEDQVNSYLPTQRRVRRLSSQERADVFMGSDMTIDDFEGYSGRVLDFTWKYLGRKDVLHVADGRSPQATFFGPSSRVPDDRWQVRPCYVVELVPKFAGHPYSSKIIFFDVQTFNVPVALAFNRSGELWRIFSALYVMPQPLPGEQASLETSVPRWMATIATDRIADTSTVSRTRVGTVTPTMSKRDIEHRFNVSALGEGR